MIIKRWNSTNTLQFGGVATTSGSTTLVVPSTRDLIPGAGISGTGIAAGATIASITNATTLVMSAAATSTNATGVVTFTGVFNEQFPKTKTFSIFNNANTASIFDANEKLRLQYLPDAVYDSLYFYDTIQAALQDEQLSECTLADIASHAFTGTHTRSQKGYYYVATTTTTISASATAIQGSYTAAGWFKTYFGGREEGLNPGGASVVLEQGDWIVITHVAGGTGGTSGTAREITFSVVNNTYAIMTGANGTNAGSPGLVPGPAGNQNLHFLRGDGTWVIPTDTNTTYTGSTSITLTGTSFSRPALEGDVTATANSNTLTIANDAVTFAKMQNITTARMLGRTSANDGDIELLTAATVRAFLNVADGATANLGTVTAVTGTGPIVSSGGTAPAISINAATTSAAGSMSSTDKTKLDGIATGATANSTDATLLARGNHTGTQTAATISDFATAVAATASVTANTAKVSNATHTGDVTGSTALTIAAQAVTYAKIQNITATNRILGRITTGAGSTEELTASNVRSIIELAAPIYIQTATPTATVTNALWYDIN